MPITTKARLQYVSVIFIDNHWIIFVEYVAIIFTLRARNMQRLFFLILACFSLQADINKPIRVYVDVVGDLMHAGHVQFFKKAKALGDYLIVGVNSDADAASYKRVPIMTLEERVATISGCRYVDETIAAPPLRVTKEWLEEHHIDLVVHGDDFDQGMLEYFYAAPIAMGIFKTVPYTQGISTSALIGRILERYGNP